MAEFFGDPVHMVSYFTIGLLFFMVIWNLVGGIMKDILPTNPGMILTFCIASYGFWYPLFSPLSSVYLGLLIMVAVCGSAFSRANIVIQSAQKGRHVVMATIISLILFEVVYAVVSYHYGKTDYHIVVNSISWCLLVYGIIRNNLIGMVIVQTPFPWKNYLYAAFVLASIIFLPVEFPDIYFLLSVGGIVGIALGSLFILKSHY